MIDKCIRDIFTRDRLEKLYDALHASGLDLSKYCYPFIPSVGKDYHDAKPKIIYVGRETAGWDDDISTPPKTLLREAIAERTNLKKLNEITENYVEKHLIPSYGGVEDKKERGRHFWRMIYQLTLNILDDNPEFRAYDKNRVNSERCFHSIAWSNLFKITKGDAHVDQEVENILLDKFNTLRSEIQCLEPDLVFFTIGSFSKAPEEAWDKGLRDVLNDPELEITQIENHVARVSGDGLGKTIVIRTPHPHPGSWGRGWSDEKKYEFIYDCLRNLWR